MAVAESVANAATAIVTVETVAAVTVATTVADVADVIATVVVAVDVTVVTTVAVVTGIVVTTAVDVTVTTVTIAMIAVETPTQCQSALKTNSTTTSTTELVTRFE